MRDHQGVRSYARVISVAVLAIAALTPCAAGQTKRVPVAAKQKAEPRSNWPVLQDVTFRSAALGRDVKYRVLLPADYNRTTKRYPVLYLLHGYLGSYINWETRTDIAEYAREFPGIIVMPDGRNSWYVNSASVPADRFEEFVVNDLVEDVQTRFRAAWRRSARLVVGLSMGGYGAMKFALKYRETFGFAASLSGAFNVPDELAAERPVFAENLRGVFGTDGSETRRLNDIYALARTADAAATPYIYLDCGTLDYFLPANRKLVAELQSAGINYEFHEVPGKHNWEYWDRRIAVVLREARVWLKNPPAIERLTREEKVFTPAPRQ